MRTRSQPSRGSGGGSSSNVTDAGVSELMIANQTMWVVRAAEISIDRQYRYIYIYWLHTGLVSFVFVIGVCVSLLQNRELMQLQHAVVTAFNRPATSYWFNHCLQRELEYFLFD